MKYTEFIPKISGVTFCWVKKGAQNGPPLLDKTNGDLGKSIF